MPSRHPRLDHAAALVQAGRVAEAAPLLEQLAAANDPLALNMLGELKWVGMVGSDQAGARTLFERAGKAGHVEAGVRATNLIGAGIGGPRDWARALDRLRAEAATLPARRRALDLLAQMKLTPDGEPAELPGGRVLSTSPRVALFDRAFTPAECDYVRGLTGERFEPATVFNSRREAVRDPIRTSDESTLAWLIEDPAVHALNRRLAALSGTNAGQGEAAQLLRYRPGQQYKAHFDFQIGAENQRALTMLVYLNDDYDGGETAFLRTGLTVKASQGDALLFANILPDGRRDDMAEHAGTPVVRGTKYILSRWIHARRWAP